MQEQHEVLDQQTEVVVLAENGLGFGEGTISARKIVSEEFLRSGVELLQNNKSTLFVKVAPNVTDDGCGDGRRTKQGGLRRFGEVVKEKLLRPKVFGGGIVVFPSMLRNLKGAPGTDENGQRETVLGDREYGARQAKELLHLTFGAHTGSHAEGEKCGCGAIDLTPEINHNIVKMESNIISTLQVVYGNEGFETNRDAITAALNVYKAMDSEYEIYNANKQEAPENQRPNYYADAGGIKTKKLLDKEGALIAELEGEHKEIIVILNDVEDTTFSQPEFEKLLKRQLGEAVPDIELPQAFAVDVWRGRRYAEHAANIAVENGWADDREFARQQAYADFLIRTLATSGTLTAGDQPVVGHFRPGKHDFALIG